VILFPTTRGWVSRTTGTAYASERAIATNRAETRNELFKAAAEAYISGNIVVFCAIDLMKWWCMLIR
jgi:hypothetical protein